MSGVQNLYKNILVAIDLSRHSVFPMEKALQLREQHQSALDVVHVVSLSIPYYSYSFSVEIQDAVYSDTREYFHQFCSQYKIPEDRQHLLIGSPKLQIVDLTDKLKTDLLIVGSHGEQHILPINFGTTAGSLIAKCKCDVLTVSINSEHHTAVNFATDEAMAT